MGEKVTIGGGTVEMGTLVTQEFTRENIRRKHVKP